MVQLRLKAREGVRNPLPEQIKLDKSYELSAIVDLLDTSLEFSLSMMLIAADGSLFEIEPSDYVAVAASEVQAGS